MTLVHPDMLSFAPVRDVLAVTSGAGRETWTNKAIDVIDLNAFGQPSVRRLTGLAVSAQLPGWSPDGQFLAWCAGPDASVMYKQQLLARGQKTIRVMEPKGQLKDLAITPDLRLGAPEKLIDLCVRQRHLWISDPGSHDPPRQLTNDPRYSDEEPQWPDDGSCILFARTDAQDAPSIWLIGRDGSELRQVAGPLRPPSHLSKLEQFDYVPYYGYTDWAALFDWHREA